MKASVTNLTPSSEGRQRIHPPVAGATDVQPAGPLPAVPRQSQIPRRRRLRREPRRRPRVLRAPRDAGRPAARHRPGQARRTVAHQCPPPRRTRQGPRPRPLASPGAHRHRPRLEPGRERVDRGLAMALRLPRPAPRRGRPPDRDRPRRHPARRRHRPLARHPTTGLEPARQRAAAAAHRTRREGDRTSPQERGHVERLPDGGEHRTGVWIANQKQRRDRLTPEQLAALA